MKYLLFAILLSSLFLLNWKKYESSSGFISYNLQDIVKQECSFGCLEAEFPNSEIIYQGDLFICKCYSIEKAKILKRFSKEDFK